MSQDLNVYDNQDENNLLCIMSKTVIPRLANLEMSQGKPPFPLLPEHRDLLTNHYMIAPKLVEASGCFSVQNDNAGLQFLRDARLESTENSDFAASLNETRLDSLFEPEFGAIGVTDFGLDGQPIGSTLLGLKPNWEGDAPPAILKSTSRFSRVGVYPFTRQWMRDTHPRFPFVWSHDPIQCLTAAIYGMPTFHVVSGTSRDHDTHYDHLMRDLRALEKQWEGATTMPQHLLLGSTLDPKASDFSAMDLVASELKRQGIDAIRTLSPHGWTGTGTETLSTLGLEGLLVDLFDAPIMQFELDMYDL